MALLQWTPTMSVGVRIIDEEHKQLVALINELDEAMARGRGRDVLGKIITELWSYAETHFATEEMYFEKFGYEDAAAHREEHAAFLADIGRFKADFDDNTLGLSAQVMAFLSDWLKTHTTGSDKKYSACFNAHGLN